MNPVPLIPLLIFALTKINISPIFWLIGLTISLQTISLLLNILFAWLRSLGRVNYLNTIIIVLVLHNQPAIGAMAVIDSANLAKATKQLAAWSRQLRAMHQQLEQSKAQHESMTGSRQLGEIFYDTELANYLPAEYYSMYPKSDFISDSYELIASIETVEQLTGSVAEVQQRIEQRHSNKQLYDHAMGLKAYQATGQRIKQLESLMQQINKTKDLKAISELQARIAIEQVSLQNTITKLQLISQLQHSESQLIQQQKCQLHKRIMNNNNTKMPRLQ